ncbi:MAG TPA: hypothetical protein VN544_10015 [Gaiellaceae bacterium]|jgi:hypothetical protein|nr:hypothetical protein [Gaiellaceae bacterium]
MAIDVEVQRLQLGDVILVDFPDQGGQVEAKVVREIDRIDRIDRTESTVRVTLRVKGRDDFVKEWALGEMVTVVRGP